MLQIIDSLERSPADTLDDLRDVIAGAYANVQTARRTLASMPPVPELTAHLQIAEAELVRASVAVNRLTADDLRPPLVPRLKISPVVPFDVSPREDLEYGS
jgi:hypothetical protein